MFYDLFIFIIYYLFIYLFILLLVPHNSFNCILCTCIALFYCTLCIPGYMDLLYEIYIII